MLFVYFICLGDIPLKKCILKPLEVFFVNACSTLFIPSQRGLSRVNTVYPESTRFISSQHDLSRVNAVYL